MRLAGTERAFRASSKRGAQCRAESRLVGAAVAVRLVERTFIPSDCVHYMLRWVNTRSERGPWSQPASATITA